MDSSTNSRLQPNAAPYGPRFEIVGDPARPGEAALFIDGLNASPQCALVMLTLGQGGRVVAASAKMRRRDENGVAIRCEAAVVWDWVYSSDVTICPSLVAAAKAGRLDFFRVEYAN